jgi:putative hydrolase of the HAD superfamily
MPLPQAILFDLDDTIITEGERYPILVQVASEFGESLPGHDPVAVADRLEAALTHYWADPEKARETRLRANGGIREARHRIVTDAFTSFGVTDAGGLASIFSSRFTELRAVGAREFDGARHTLETLRNTGVKLGLVTNGAAQIQRAKLERFSLTSLFDHIQIEGEHAFGKPDPRAYSHALEALGADPASTWMVGDNLEWEVAAPQRLGIFAIWHDHLGRGLPANTSVHPDRIIRKLPELLV